MKRTRRCPSSAMRCDKRNSVYTSHQWIRKFHFKLIPALWILIFLFYFLFWYFRIFKKTHLQIVSNHVGPFCAFIINTIANNTVLLNYIRTKKLFIYAGRKYKGGNCNKGVVSEDAGGKVRSEKRTGVTHNKERWPYIEVTFYSYHKLSQT